MPLNYWSSLSESEVVATLDRITHGVAAIGPDWRFRYLNQPAATMLDRPRSALIGRTLWSYFHNTGTEHFRSALEACVRDRRASRSPSTTPRCSGGLSAAAFRKDENVVVLFRDTSDRQLADERLREYSDRMSEAERIAHFGVWRWDLRTGLGYVSDELNAIYGPEPLLARPNDELIGQVHPADRERVAAKLAHARRTAQPFFFAHRIVRPDGERTLRCQGRVATGPDGEATALIGVCHDLTERFRTERALGLSRRRMRAILDHVPSLVSVRDLTTATSWSTRSAVACSICRWRRSSGGAPTICSRSPPRHSARDARALAEDDPVYDESVLVVVGEPRTFDTVTFALPDEFGRAIETCTIGTDVTERRELESERRERVQYAQGYHLGRPAPVCSAATG